MWQSERGVSHEKVHNAWQDESNEGFLICYDVNLIFENDISYSVQPAEVDIDGRYPGLGLAMDLRKKEEILLSDPFDNLSLPIKVCEVVQTDPLGEDVVSQYTFVLTDGNKIIIRHVYPPMTLGIKIEAVNA